MARGLGRTGSTRQQNGDPPASTLAAQLVNHLTDGKTHPKNQDQETFQQLLHEVLGVENEGNSEIQTQGIDNDVDYKLVYVIVKAGLETLTNGNASSKNFEASRKAIESLTAVENTLKKNPNIPFILASGQESAPHAHGPFYLWLVPRLLAVAAQVQDDLVVKQVIKILRMIVSLEKQAHLKEARVCSIVKYIRGFIKGVFWENG